ncbi:collagen triple helix repeat (20 copies) domain-containing protein [Ophiocordyceps camponoti-floridani]|uniref:Collagen triple helix repeat (20 copies) domain-containing protein n=1 Tax=Ophiocordyceps camponoti-floridani TaxID=2030778 RepID=A0A8H4VFD6_9HYPO|nr:collagen triple helix repeat (20 copies) domain-containing protein [Ophiocordyceps camponoti-floridani]
MSSLVNKVKGAMQSKDEATTASTDPLTNPTAPRTDNTTTGTSHVGSHDYASGDNYAIGGNNRGVDSSATRTDGPHSSNLANKADPRVDSDRDGSRNLGANPHGTAISGTSGLDSSHHHTGTTTGTGIDSSRKTGTTSTTTAGPHGSDLANKLDPRVDSDLDGSRTIGSNPQTSSTHHPTTTTGTTGTSTSGYHGGIHDTTHHSSHTSGAGVGAGAGAAGAAGAAATGAATHHHAGHDVTSARGHDSAATRTDGPHSSNLANKADPRVDSDRDRSTNLGANPSGTATTGSSTTHGSTGLGDRSTGVAHRSEGRLPEGTAGPHSSRVANAADPRVDSDLDSSHKLGGSHAGTTGAHTGSHTGATGAHTGSHTGATGTHSGSLTGATGAAGVAGATGAHSGTHSGTHTGAHTGSHHGTHDTHKSGLTSGTHSSTTGTTTGTHSTGPAPNTAGPHSKDILNKLDPRVDSDLDGSKTVGGNKTFDRS